jgi:hypothetical protein
MAKAVDIDPGAANSFVEVMEGGEQTMIVNSEGVCVTSPEFYRPILLSEGPNVDQAKVRMNHDAMDVMIPMAESRRRVAASRLKPGWARRLRPPANKRKL